MILLKIGNFYCWNVIFLEKWQKSKVDFKGMLIFRFLDA